jgi:sugar lactone lactonase YvrE
MNPAGPSFSASQPAGARARAGLATPAAFGLLVSLALGACSAAPPAQPSHTDGDRRPASPAAPVGDGGAKADATNGRNAADAAADDSGGAGGASSGIAGDAPAEGPTPTPGDGAGAGDAGASSDSSGGNPIGMPAPPVGAFPLAAVQAAKPTLYAATTARVEGPTWRAGDVFFAADGVGLMRADGAGKVFRYHPMLNPIGSFTLADDSLLVCDKQHVLVQIFSDGKVARLVDGGTTFCNDITVDGAGNVFFSDSRAAAIMRLTPAGALSRWASARKYPNGLEIDREGKFLYFSDTGVNLLFRVPIAADGTAGAVESLGPMIADGMAIDAWGNLWLAQVTAGIVMVYDPGKRQIIARIDAGGPQATNLSFGGPQHDTLFTTVAGKGIMRVPVGVRGFSHPGAAHYTVKAMLDLVPANTPAD